MQLKIASLKFKISKLLLLVEELENSYKQKESKEKLDKFLEKKQLLKK